MQESRSTRIRRLIYQSSYTGMKETDLLLGRFAQDHLAALSDQELGQYEALLEALQVVAYCPWTVLFIRSRGL